MTLYLIFLVICSYFLASSFVFSNEEFVIGTCLLLFYNLLFFSLKQSGNYFFFFKTEYLFLLFSRLLYILLLLGTHIFIFLAALRFLHKFTNSTLLLVTLLKLFTSIIYLTISKIMVNIYHNLSFVLSFFSIFLHTILLCRLYKVTLLNSPLQEEEGEEEENKFYPLPAPINPLISSDAIIEKFVDTFATSLVSFLRASREEGDKNIFTLQPSENKSQSESLIISISTSNHFLIEKLIDIFTTDLVPFLFLEDRQEEEGEEEENKFYPLPAPINPLISSDAIIEKFVDTFTTSLVSFLEDSKEDDLKLFYVKESTEFAMEAFKLFYKNWIFDEEDDDLLRFHDDFFDFIADDFFDFIAIEDMVLPLNEEDDFLSLNHNNFRIIDIEDNPVVPAWILNNESSFAEEGIQNFLLTAKQELEIEVAAITDYLAVLEALDKEAIAEAEAKFLKVFTQNLEQLALAWEPSDSELASLLNPEPLPEPLAFVYGVDFLAEWLFEPMLEKGWEFYLRLGGEKFFSFSLEELFYLLYNLREQDLSSSEMLELQIPKKFPISSETPAIASFLKILAASRRNLELKEKEDEALEQYNASFFYSSKIKTYLLDF